MTGQGLHIVASVFFVLLLVVLGLVALIFTYVDEILGQVRALSAVKVQRRVTREENDTARRMIAAKRKDKE